MSKNSIYVMDVISYYVLSVLAVFFTYNDLVFVESIENEYNVYSVFSLNPTGEKIGFFLMFIASAFLLFSYAVMPFIFMISVSTQQVIPTSRFTEILKYIILLLPLVFYAISFVITVILKIKGTKFDE